MLFDYEYFKSEILDFTAIDLNAYKEAQMKRRIDTLIGRHCIAGYQQYVQALQKDKALFDEFVSYITINVSEFYRNPDQWKLLDKEVFPELIRKFGTRLKIWSAACSTGDEPYSLVMALSKHVPMHHIKIYATDLDKLVIAKARTGIYAEKSIAAVPEDLKEKYFAKVGPSYKISDEIKARVEFCEHNLLKDAYQTECHMIVCRNVMIYFTEEAKDEVFRKFCHSLASGGVLFIGNAEQLIHYKEMGYDRKGYFFYQKV